VFVDNQFRKPVFYKEKAVQKPVDDRMRRKLEALKELKAEYLIGSQDAFLYLKAMERYEKILDALAKDPAIQIRPTLKETSRLCADILRAANFWLEMVCITFSTPENLSVAAQIFIPELYLNDKFDEDIFTHIFSLDVLMVAKCLLRSVSEIPTRQQVWDFFTLHGETLDCFTVESDQRVSWQDISLEANLRSCSPKRFWSQSMAHAYVFKDKYSEDYIATIKRSIEAKDCETCHQFLQSLRLTLTKEDVEGWVINLEGFNLKARPSEEEFEYLLQYGDIIERAEREFTLGNFEVERKVAIAYMYEFIGDENLASASEMVDDALRCALKMRTERQKRIEVFRSQNAPSVILDNAETSLRKARYLYLSLYQNRRWLERCFSQ